MKKIYIAPEAEIASVISENLLAVSVPGESSGDFTDRYDTAENRRPWGDLWVK